MFSTLVSCWRNDVKTYQAVNGRDALRRVLRADTCKPTNCGVPIAHVDVLVNLKRKEMSYTLSVSYKCDSCWENDEYVEVAHLQCRLGDETVSFFFKLQVRPQTYPNT